MSSDAADRTAVMRSALHHAVAALKRADVPFALAGGYALFARGAREPVHDVDVVVEPAEMDIAEKALQEAGFEIEHQGLDWLAKAWWRQDGAAACVDLIHKHGGVPVDADLLGRAEVMQVLAMATPVLPAHDILAAKLRVLNEHECNFAALLPAARALREQVDWSALRRDLADQPYAEAFLHLLDRLDVTSPD